MSRHPFLTIAAGAVALGLALAPAGSRAQDDRRPLRITAGGVTGVYFALSSAFCRLLEPSLPIRVQRCQVATSPGSVTNLRLVRAGAADLGLAQAGLIGLAVEGAGLFTVDGANPNLRVLFSTVLEKLTIVAARGLNLRSADDLLGRTVDFGPFGSGSRATAERYLGSLGLGFDDFLPVSTITSALNPRELCRGNADAFVFIAAHPNSVVQEAISRCDATIVPGNTEKIARFADEFPEYVPAVIPADLYPGITEDIPTFGVRAFVIADARLPDEAAYDLTKTVFESLAELRRLHLAFEDLEIADLLRPCPGAPYHRGALRYFREAGITPPACD